MKTTTLEKFKHYFSPIDFTNQSILNDIYSKNIIFKDPIHEIEGIENLKKYFNKLNENLIEGSFYFTDESMVENKVFLSWNMGLKLKRPKKNVKASGISVLIIEDKIISQRDYFDAGELFYENIPVLGGIIRSIKKKLSK
ncbi:nuclear transport factor 2 family protein [Marivirga tractuosa]|uniref:nuclear transport factor 2 family protein n=1 Tax=Marivirga tractuosa TaxID=1006 RepID=UPI0035CF8F40